MKKGKDNNQENLPPSLFDNLDIFAPAPAEPPKKEGKKSKGETAAAPLRPKPGLTGIGPMQQLYDFNFRQYSAYVICSRAIPAVEDGLKPVQRNFGSLLTGMPHAAVRYIECRLTELAKKEVFNRKTTTYVPNYDGRKEEPVYLPAKIPLLLMMGADGIAVGLSTAILPHNFIELLEAEIALIQKKPFQLYPDFQLGGLMDVSEYQDGLGKVKVRAKIEKDGKNKLVITELPWGETTDSLAESIEDAIKKPSR